MARQSIPTANATSGRVCVEQSGGTGVVPLAATACSTCRGRSLEAGACDGWTLAGTPPGRKVSTMCCMYEACESVTWRAERWISTLSKSDTGPSSSTFHRADNASVNFA
eukprot:1076539-Pleurochrysis_carterae.AAC.1